LKIVNSSKIKNKKFSIRIPEKLLENQVEFHIYNSESYCFIISKLKKKIIINIKELTGTWYYHENNQPKEEWNITKSQNNEQFIIEKKGCEEKKGKIEKSPDGSFILYDYYLQGCNEKRKGEAKLYNNSDEIIGEWENKNKFKLERY